MSLPSTRKSTLAKLATIFAIGFVTSLGLCGINFLVIAGGMDGRSAPAKVLFVFAYLEIAGMIICAIGLLIVGLIAVSKAIYRLFDNSPDSSEPNSSEEDQ